MWHPPRLNSKSRHWSCGEVHHHASPVDNHFNSCPSVVLFSLSHGLNHFRQERIVTMKVVFNKQIFHSPKNNNNNTISNSQNNKSHEDSISFDFDSSLVEFHESVGSMNGHLYEKRRSMNDRWSLSSRWLDSSSKSIKAPSSSDDPMSHMWTKSAMNQRQESSSSSFLRRNNK
jgi:hypothetical protein